MMNSIIKPHQKMSGFTLVELLIVLALSGFLTAAVARIVIGNKDNVLLADSYSKIQESSRFAMDYLARDFRMAGYMGCSNSELTPTGNITNMLSPTDSVAYKPGLHSFANPIRAIDNYNPGDSTHNALFTSVVDPTTPATMRPVAGTDVFISSTALSTDLMLRVEHLQSQTSFVMSGPLNQISVIQQGSVLMITDCAVGHIFSVSGLGTAPPTQPFRTVMHFSSVNPGIDNTGGFFNVDYPVGSQILLMNTTLFYVGPSNVVPGQNSLFRASTINGGLVEELVPYVEDMQFRFAVDTRLPANDPGSDGQPDAYMTATEIADGGFDMKQRAYSVNVELTMTGDANVGSTAVDGKLSKRYSRLISFRNAGLREY